MKAKSMLIGCFCLILPSVSPAAELIWYLAASMSVPAKKVVDRYNRQNSADQVFLIVGGSGQLLSKIQLSGKGDIYSPASAAYIGKCASLDLVNTYKPFLIQSPVFGVSAQAAANIKTFSDLTQQGIRLSIGNPKTMALGGIYLEIEKKMGPELASKIRGNVQLEALNVTQIASYIKRGLIDAGTIFNTVALAHKIHYIEIPKEYNVDAETFWIELKIGNHSVAVQKFSQYVQQNFAVFEHYGFKHPISAVQ